MKAIPWLTGLSAILLLMPPISNAQSITANGELPVCNTVASDADGDGFGWELMESSRWYGEYGSCRVTAESTPQPVITNRETGAQVNLSRAFWNANNDIANRKIRCEYFSYNQSTSVYEVNDPAIPDRSLWDITDTLYLHEPLSRELPRMSTMFRFAVSQLPSSASVTNDTNPPWEDGLYGFVPLWTVNDGIYYGASPLSFSPYVEIIDHGAGAANAVRIWFESEETEANAAGDYFACHALDGNALVPTGAPGATVDSFITLDNSTTVSMTTETPTSDNFINLETGQSVEFTDGIWNYNQQIAMHHVSCREHQWEWRTPSVYGSIDLDDSLAGWNTIFHPYTGGDSVWVTRRSYTSRDAPFREWQTERVQIESGVLGQWTDFDSRFSGWELVDTGFRLWNVENNNRMYECSVGQLTQVAGNLAFARDVSFVPQSVVEPPDTTEPTGTTDPTDAIEPIDTTGITNTTEAINTTATTDTTPGSEAEGTDGSDEQDTGSSGSQSSGGGSLNSISIIWLLLLAGFARVHRFVL